MSGRDYNRHRSKFSAGSTAPRSRSRSRSPLSEERKGAAEGEGPRARPSIMVGNKTKSQAGIQMKLQQAGPQASKAAPATPKPKASLVASVFNEDSDSEPEEMPPEARMRMKNIGRDTPTSSGPNSFGKTKQGFCDPSKLYEMSVKKLQQESPGGNS
ncbi:PEST proteolytic signal-containing nuclear protein-like isoform X1 [Cloeon dipterum]|uniref:PEST proteolytic signal-containing nuclear protein-like isoform X1 n=1 Tax=Cloeon dipterum TaxID=197152 RepID=UPI00322002BF